MPEEATVYLVDDDDAVRDSLKILLESHGMTVADHGSAQEFLSSGVAGMGGCLVLDLHLPVIGGLDLIRILRQRKIAIPVVFITGGSDSETRARAMEAGAVAFLEKPVSEDGLLCAIRTALAPGSDRSPRTDADLLTTA
jgi:FixJ family two-component response regulator